MPKFPGIDIRYSSAPDDMIARQVEVRQTKDTIEIYRGPRLVATHKRIVESTGRKYRLPEHRHRRGQGLKRSDPAPEEKSLLARIPEIGAYVEALKKRYAGRATLALRRLLRMAEEYPREPLLDAIQSATQYGLFDLERVESMILRKLAREYFLIIPRGPDREGGDE